MEIRDIAIDDVNIPDIQVYQPPGWTTNPSAIFAAPPITQEIGVPIVNIPGCVEAHEQNTTRERSGIIGEDDPKGVKTFCDAGVPSFGPIDYNPDELEYNYEPPVPKVAPTPEPEITPVKQTETPPPPKCPTREQELKNPIGKILEGNKKITGYEQIAVPSQRDSSVSAQQPVPATIVPGSSFPVRSQPSSLPSSQSVSQPLTKGQQEALRAVQRSSLPQQLRR